MIFETHNPPEPLAQHIESIFHFRDFEPDHSIERVVPTGHLFFLFELDGFERQLYDNETLQPMQQFRRAWVSGMQKHYLSISAHPKSEMFVIQFKAAGAYPFLQFPLHEISNRVVDGESLLDGALLHLHTELLAANTAQEKFASAEKWLLDRYNDTLAPPEAILDVLQELRSEPASRLSEVTAQFPGAQKTLIDQFQKYVGLTPKTYQRIQRFNDIFVQLNNKELLGWPDIAARCGYSDQSHFIREFRHFSGFSPTEFLRQAFEGDEANFFPLDRDG